MVREFHFWRGIDPSYTSRNLQQELPQLLQQKMDTCLVSIRNPAEAQATVDFVRDNGDVVLDYVFLTRTVATPETSDEHLEEIRGMFETLCSQLPSRLCLNWTFENNGTIGDYQRFLTTVIAKPAATGDSAF